MHCDAALLEAALNDVPALGRLLDATVADGLIDDEFRQAFQYSLDELRKRPELRGWWTTFFVHAGVVCGAGGFRGPPDADGLVEIGYSIAPALRGRGLATAAARLLVDQSLADPRVNVVQAHTLATPNASTRVLEKMGFQRVAELIDPKEHPDPIWRWQLRRHYT